jgi:uncharacterized spore protein YtfJ
MTIESFVARADEALSVRRVFGEPINKNGLTVIPVARVTGGGGGGEGHAPQTEGAEGVAAEAVTGVGGGFGLRAQPAGVYVLKGEEVSWKPAVDINRLMLGMQIVAIVALLVARSIARSRAG